MVPPQIDIYSPTNGDHYPSGSNIDLEWYSEDESGFSGDAIDVYLSETLLPYDYYPLIEGLPNTGFILISTPDISTESAKIKLYSKNSSPSSFCKLNKILQNHSCSSSFYPPPSFFQNFIKIVIFLYITTNSQGFLDAYFFLI